MNTTPKPRATKNRSGELVGPPPPSSLSLVPDGFDPDDVVELDTAPATVLVAELTALVTILDTAEVVDDIVGHND